jgi:hypothetical protein
MNPGRPSLTRRRLGELDAISRERGFLTLAEQRECPWLAREDRHNTSKRRRYAEDAEYRQREVARERARREARA